jgi:hypothetical protein
LHSSHDSKVLFADGCKCFALSFVSFVPLSHSHLTPQGIFQGVDRLLKPSLPGQGIADVKRPKAVAAAAGRRLLQQAQQGVMHSTWLPPSV